MMANADGRALLLSKRSAVEAALLNEKAWSNDDIEDQFSALVRRCGFKPDPATCEGVFRSIDALSAIHHSADKEFHTWVSGRKQYNTADSTTEVLTKWNDGTAVAPNSKGLTDFDKLRQSELEGAAKGHQKPIRANHKITATSRM